MLVVIFNDDRCAPGNRTSAHVGIVHQVGRHLKIASRPHPQLGSTQFNKNAAWLGGAAPFLFDTKKPAQHAGRFLYFQKVWVLTLRNFCNLGCKVFDLLFDTFANFKANETSNFNTCLGSGFSHCQVWVHNELLTHQCDFA